MLRPASRFLACALVLLVSASLTACSGRASEPDFGRKDVQILRDRSQALVAALNQQDVDRIMDFYPAEALLMPPHASSLRGRDAVAQYYRELFAEGPIEFEAVTTDVGGHGPLAYETGTYVMNRAEVDGGTTRDRGKYTRVWKLQGGQWRISYVVWNSDLPEPLHLASR